MYYLLFVLLLVTCSFKLSNDKKIYRILWLFLTLVLIFRYGQGTDYISYNYHYQSIGRMTEIKNVTYYGLDYGYMIVNKLFNMTGLSFQWYVGIVSTFMMFCLDRFIKNYSTKPVLSLLLFYPTYYLTYYSSTIAQGIVIALFIGFMLEWLLKKKFVPYIAFCVIASTIHFSGLVLFLGLLIHIGKVERVFRYLTIISFALSGLGIVLGQRVEYVKNYYESPHIISIIEKAIWLVVLIYLYRKVESKTDEEDRNLLKLYYIGFIVAITFLFFPTVSSRLAAYYKVIEVVIFCRLLYKYNNESQMTVRKWSVVKISYISILIVSLTTAMFYKNINQYLQNGKYYDTSFFSYKYITVFQQDDLYKYRDSVFRGLID